MNSKYNSKKVMVDDIQFDRKENMHKYNNLVGMKFGKYTVIAETDKRYPTKFVCVCECGATHEVRSGDLMNGSSTGCKSCISRTHGMTKTRIHKTWADMKGRCSNPNHSSFPRYGGRGISVCDEWIESFEKFRDWAYENGYSEKLTIDRIDNNGNYEPSNCRWATMSMQNKNREYALHEINGISKTFPQWCEFTGLKYAKVYQRIHTSGKSMEEAFELNEK